MDKPSSTRSVVLTKEFDEVFVRMLELSGFDQTSRTQRLRLLSGLLRIYPNFVQDLLSRKTEFIGPIVMA